MTEKLDIKNRITAIEKMRLGDIADNERNPKSHPKRQGEAIRGVVEEIGWAGVPLIYYSERQGGWAYVDGHLRKREFPELLVDVAKTDLTDPEADYLLLTYDPIAAMAVADKEKMDGLMRDIQSGNAAVQEMLAEMAERAGLDYGKEEPVGRDESGDIPEQYMILIECEDEQEQVALLDRFTVEGLKCKALLS